MGVLRSFVPNVSYDPPTTAKVGRPEAFADGLTFVSDRRVFIVRDGKAFRAVSAVCTHLGCTVRPEAVEEADPADPDRRRQVQVYYFSLPVSRLALRRGRRRISRAPLRARLRPIA